VIDGPEESEKRNPENKNHPGSAERNETVGATTVSLCGEYPYDCLALNISCLICAMPHLSSYTLVLVGCPMPIVSELCCQETTLMGLSTGSVRDRGNSDKR